LLCATVGRMQDKGRQQTSCVSLPLQDAALED
jgi:hypothetical protein